MAVDKGNVYTDASALSTTTTKTCLGSQRSRAFHAGARDVYYGIIFASTCLFPIYQDAPAPTVTSAVVLRRFRFYIWDSVDILLYVSPIGSVADPDTKDPHNFRSKTSFVI